MDEISDFDVGIEAVNRRHAQLLLDQLVDEGECQFCGRIGPTSGLSDLIAVRARDSVAVMPVGDQHIVGSQALSDGCDAQQIDHPLHDMLNALIGH